MCKWNCGLKLFGHEMDSHKEKCPNFLITCDKCKLSFKLKDKEHDCFEELKKRCQSSRDSLQGLKTNLGINYE